MNEPLDPRPDPALEERLRAHFADRAAHEPLPGEPGEPSVPGRARAWWQRPGLLASAAAVLVVAGVAAGLALAGDDDPEDLDVVGPSTTTTVPATSTTVAVTPPTVEATGTTTTVLPPPPNDVRSVIVSIDGVLGWWDGTRFVRASDGEVPAVGGERYTLVGLDATTTAVGSAPEEGCELTDPPGTDIDVGLEYPEPEARLEPPPIAVTGVADPAPRSPSALGSQAAYVAAASDVLRGLGIEDASPALVQVLRVDLEGDGRDEVFVVAERLTDPVGLFAAADDYSVLFLRQVVDEQVVTTVVEYSIARPQHPDETPFVSVARVGAFADVNGDGVMELVTRSVYYEGAGTSVWQVSPGSISRVLSEGCGA